MVRWTNLDLSGTYRVVIDLMLPDAAQVADPFHVYKHANMQLDECRRWMESETAGHRGREGPPAL